MPSNNRHQRNLVHAVHDSLARRPRNWLTNWSQGCTTPRSQCRAWTKRSGSSTRKALGTAGMSAGPRAIHHAASRRPTKNGHASAPDIMYIHTHTCTHACKNSSRSHFGSSHSDQAILGPSLATTCRHHLTAATHASL